MTNKIVGFVEVDSTRLYDRCTETCKKLLEQKKEKQHVYQLITNNYKAKPWYVRWFIESPWVVPNVYYEETLLIKCKKLIEATKQSTTVLVDVSLMYEILNPDNWDKNYYLKRNGIKWELS